MSRFMAAIYDWFMQDTERACLASWRSELLQHATGDVLEVGAGTGANLNYYPDTIRSLTLTEPDFSMRRKLQQTLEKRGSQKPVVRILDAPAEHLGIPDQSVDTVVCTLVLCSVHDPKLALAEFRRVLKPSGRLLFIEHVGAEGNPGRLQWQRRVEPVWRRVAGNCHVTRNTEASLGAIGFTLKQIQRESMRKALPWIRPSIRGIAVPASDS